MSLIRPAHFHLLVSARAIKVWFGNKTFAQAGLPASLKRTVVFEILEGGAVNMIENRVDAKGNQAVMVAFKEK